MMLRSLAPVRLSVTAVIVTQPVISVPAFVMNCLHPFTTHSPSSRRAVVRVLPASGPASGSVRPNAASRFPAHSCGSHSYALLGASHQRWIGMVPSEVCAATVIPTDESTRASSSIAIA